MNLNAVVTDAVLLLERTTPQKVTLLVELEPALYRLNGDQAAWAHALMNVCVNAVDAMPDGGTLTIRTMNGPDSKVMLDVMYDLPAIANVKECVVSEEVILNHEQPILIYEEEAASA